MAPSAPTPLPWRGWGSKHQDPPAPKTRSRSPQQRGSQGLPGIRRDAPSRKQRSIGADPKLVTVAAREAAMREFVEDFSAPSTRRANEAKWRTIGRLLLPWGLGPLPVTAEVIVALGSSLKMGGYRSAEGYLHLLRVRAERGGQTIPPALDRLFKDAARSCARGLGPPVRPLALPLLRLGELPSDDGPWSVGGPVGPRNLLIAGSWFLMRELEASTTRAALAVVSKEPLSGEEVVTWHLPASKNDQSALGAARTHGCCCRGAAGVGCPVCSIKAQHALLRRLFPQCWRDGAFAPDFPLFPTTGGVAAEKHAVAETIAAAARLLGCPAESADGSARITGHTMRITGAQGLARAGLDPWAVQLLGRWGSATVLQYIQEVPLERSSAWARQAVGRPLSEAVASTTPGALVADLTMAPSLPSAVVKGIQVALPAALDEACATDAASQPEDCTYVESEKGFLHWAPPEPPEFGLQFWATACGWKFAASRASTTKIFPDRKGYKFLCAKCFPALRSARKSALGTAVVGQAGVDSA